MNPNEDNLTIEEREKQLDLMNLKILRLNKILNKIPFTFLKIFYFKRKIKTKMDERDIFWKELRTDTRKKYPERFSTQEALK